MSGRAAAIDIGTNSVLLLIAERRGADIVPVLERATITRLGKGVDATRELDPSAVARTLACLEDYAREIQKCGAGSLDVAGTSAMRDARGGEAFVERAKLILGVTPRVISGEDEARLTFAGALSGLDLPTPLVTVFDIGGGSTEIILGDGSGKVEQAVSLDIGSVRLTERHVRSDPPSIAELDAIRADARAELRSFPWASEAERSLVGVAGTVTTLAAIARDIVPYDGARVHGAKISKGDLESVVEKLSTLPLAERRNVRGLDAGRADVIVAGGVLVLELVRASGGTEIIASDRGVRWGLVRALLD